MPATKYVLDGVDLAAINQVRTILRNRFRSYPESGVDGILAATAEAAGRALFDLLNAAKHDGKMHIPRRVLHNDSDELEAV